MAAGLLVPAVAKPETTAAPPSRPSRCVSEAEGLPTTRTPGLPAEAKIAVLAKPAPAPLAKPKTAKDAPAKAEVLPPLPAPGTPVQTAAPLAKTVVVRATAGAPASTVPRGLRREALPGPRRPSTTAETSLPKTQTVVASRRAAGRVLTARPVPTARPTGPGASTGPRGRAVVTPRRRAPVGLQALTPGASA